MAAAAARSYPSAGGPLVGRGGGHPPPSLQQQHDHGHAPAGKASSSAPAAAGARDDIGHKIDLHKEISEELKFKQALGIVGDGLQVTHVTFEGNFSLLDLEKRHDGAHAGVFRVAPNAEQMWQKATLDDAGVVAYSGAPKRAMIKQIYVARKRSTCPIALGYTVNHLVKKGAHPNKFHQSGGGLLDDIEAFADDDYQKGLASEAIQQARAMLDYAGQTVVHGATKKPLGHLLYTTPHGLDPLLYQAYADVTDDDFTRGVTKVEDRYVINVKNEEHEKPGNRVIPKLIMCNGKEFRKRTEFEIDLKVLYEEASRTGQINISSKAYEHLVLLGRKYGLAQVESTVSDLTQTSVLLTPSTGNDIKAGAFRDVRRHVEANFDDDQVEQIMGQKNHVKVDLVIVHAMPGV